MPGAVHVDPSFGVSPLRQFLGSQAHFLRSVGLRGSSGPVVLQHEVVAAAGLVPVWVNWRQAAFPPTKDMINRNTAPGSCTTASWYTGTYELSDCGSCLLLQVHFSLEMEQGSAKDRRGEVSSSKVTA